MNVIGRHPAKQNKQIKKCFKKGRGDYLRLHCTQSADSNHSDAAIQRSVQRWVLFAYFWWQTFPFYTAY